MSFCNLAAEKVIEEIADFLYGRKVGNFFADFFLPDPGGNIPAIYKYLFAIFGEGKLSVKKRQGRFDLFLPAFSPFFYAVEAGCPVDASGI